MVHSHFPTLVQHVSDAYVLPGSYCLFLCEGQPGRAAHTCLGSYPLHSSAYLSVLCDYQQSAIIVIRKQVFWHLKVRVFYHLKLIFLPLAQIICILYLYNYPNIADTEYNG